MQARGFIGYDWFKLIVAVILALLLLVLGFTGGSGIATAAPVVRMPAAGAQVPAGNVAFSGTGTPGSTIRVLVDGVLAGQTQVNSDGTWTLNAPLGDPGSHTVVAQAIDAAGTVAAAAPLTLAVAGSVPPSPVTADAVTTVALAGSVTAEATPAATAVATMMAPTTLATVAATTDATTDATSEATTGATSGATSATSDTTSAATAGATTDTTSVVTAAATSGATSVATTSATTDATTDVTSAATVAPTTEATAPAATVAPTTASAAGTGAAQTAAITAPADGAQLPVAPFTMTGTGAPGSQIEILNSDNVIGTVTVAADGTWSLPVTPTAGTASYGVRAVGSTDLAGTPIRVTIGAPSAVCASLAVGCEAWVTRERGLPLRLRSGVGTGAAIVDRLPPGTEMTLLEGPQEANGYHWWRVRTPGKREGWVAGEELRLQPD